MTERDVAWAAEHTTPNSCEIREGMRCGHILETTGPDYPTTHRARLAARKKHTHEETR